MGPVDAGTEIGGCVLEELVGRGGMGVVYKARQLALNRSVAIKLIAPERTSDADTRERFVRESRAAAAVEHPNVLPVYGAGIADGQAYLVMRYVAGQDLRALVRATGPLAVERALEITEALGYALDAIHAAGFVHRDVKPANVLIDERGNTYLSDFGLAKHALTTQGLTASDRWVGTLDFAAPEQIRGGWVDARTDVYSLGCVLFLMLTGAVPFERESDEAKLWAHLQAMPPLVSSLRSDLPLALDDVVQRALAKAPEDRFPSAGDLARAARAAVQGGSPEPERSVARGPAAPSNAPEEPGLLSGAATAPTRHAGERDRRRWSVIAAALAAVIVAAAAIVLFAVGGSGNKSAPPARASSPTPVPHVGATVKPVGFRPRDVAMADGDLWVISSARSRLERIAADTLRHHGVQTRIGEGARSIAAHNGVVWVAIGRQDEVLKIDASSGRVVARLALPAPATPWRVAANASGLWVAGHVPNANDVLFHYRTRGSLIDHRPVEQDITALTLGRGRVWAAVSGARVFSFDTHLRHRASFFLVDPAAALTYGAGYVWASIPADNAVSRLDPNRAGSVTTTAAGHTPTGVVVAHGDVFVASNVDHRLVVLAPKTGEPVGAPLRVPPNPYALTAGAGHVWVTGTAANTLTRVDY